MPVASVDAWDQFFQAHPQAHFLQSPQWGELKSGELWTPVHQLTGSCGALVLVRQLAFGFTMAYVPKGPLGQDCSSLWPELDAVCRQHRAVFLKIEPDSWVEHQPDLSEHGFKVSAQSIQPRRTIVVDISPDEDEILAAMKQKTRYNIRLAERKGVVVQPSSDVHTFHQLMGVTGERDGFGVHTLAYYQKAYDLFHSAGMGELLIAEYEGKPLAGLFMVHNGQRAWYLYGASNNQHRELMPTYLIQWEAIRRAKQLGCTEYDLWGVPDYDEAELEAQFTQRHDGLWGVYRFKRGFGGQLKRAGASWDRVYRPVLYHLYNLALSMKWIKDWLMRLKALIPFGS